MREAGKDQNVPRSDWPLGLKLIAAFLAVGLPFTAVQTALRLYLRGADSAATLFHHLTGVLVVVWGTVALAAWLRSARRPFVLITLSLSVGLFLVNAGMAISIAHRLALDIWTNGLSIDHQTPAVYLSFNWLLSLLDAVMVGYLWRHELGRKGSPQNAVSPAIDRGWSAAAAVLVPLALFAATAVSLTVGYHYGAAASRRVVAEHHAADLWHLRESAANGDLAAIDRQIDSHLTMQILYFSGFLFPGHEVVDRWIPGAFVPDMSWSDLRRTAIYRLANPATFETEFIERAAEEVLKATAPVTGP